jgi:ComF family protein
MLRRRQLADWGSALRDLVYPPQCLACRAPLESLGLLRFCQTCLDQLDLFAGTQCDRCGAPRTSGLPAANFCPHCRHLRFRFDRGLALGAYDGPLRELVLLTKRRAGASTALGLAHLLMESHGEHLRREAFDLVAPVPMHWRRRLARQASGPDLIAEVVAERLRVPLVTSLVRRTRSTTPQFQLPVSRRKRNVRRAFALRWGHALNSANVLLVDDILTTGATCSEIARVLKRGGAARVTVVVLARSFAGS